MSPADRTTLGVSYAICAELAKRRTQTRSEVCFQLAGGCLTASSVNFRCKSITGRELSMSTAFRNIENDDESHQDDADATLEEKKTRGFSRSLLREYMLRDEDCDQMCLYDWAHRIHNPDENRRQVVLHLSGKGFVDPRYVSIPIKEDYARSLLTMFHPFREIGDVLRGHENVVASAIDFLENSDLCPETVRERYYMKVRGWTNKESAHARGEQDAPGVDDDEDEKNAPAFPGVVEAQNNILSGQGCVAEEEYDASRIAKDHFRGESNMSRASPFTAELHESAKTFVQKLRDEHYNSLNAENRHQDQASEISSSNDDDWVPSPSTTEVDDDMDGDLSSDCLPSSPTEADDDMDGDLSSDWLPSSPTEADDDMDDLLSSSNASESGPEASSGCAGNMQTPFEPEANYVHINAQGPDQKIAIKVLMHHFKKWHDYINGTGERPELLRLVIIGAAGTGKSWIIKTICNHIRSVTGEWNSVVTCAPTGVAAAAIKGSTVHRLAPHNFNNRQQDEQTAMQRYPEAKRPHLEDKFLKTMLMIVDEAFMMTQSMLGYLDDRIKTTRNVLKTMELYRHLCEETFGGIPMVVLFGDPYQLPPVGGRAIWMRSETLNETKAENLGRLVYTEFNNVLEMKHIVRTKEKELQELQNACRTNYRKRAARTSQLPHRRRREESKRCGFQQRHLDVLRSRHWSKLSELEKKVFERKAINVFPYWKMANQVLNEYLRLLREPVFIDAANFEAGARLGARLASQHRRETRLHRTVGIAKGAMVQLVSNIVPEIGLSNGQLGSIVHIQTTDASKIGPYDSSDVIDYVVVEFPSYTGRPWDSNNPKWIPIPRLTVRCNHKCCNITRIPMEINKISSIHKVQGATIGANEVWEKIIVDFGEIEHLDPGLFYVVLTRVKSIKDIAFTRMPTQKLLDSVGSTDYDRKLNEYQSRIDTLDRETRRRYRHL